MLRTLGKKKKKKNSLEKIEELDVGAVQKLRSKKKYFVSKSNK